MDCKDSKLAPYPKRIKGTVSGFILGKAIVCGGAEMTYVDCLRHNEGSKDCDRDYECVKTTGGTQWCTGPKTGACYSLDTVSKVIKAKTFKKKKKETLNNLQFTTIGMDFCL